MLYSNGIEVTQFDVPDVRFSDHRPLICDFQVRPRTDDGHKRAGADHAKHPAANAIDPLAARRPMPTASPGWRSTRPARRPTACRARSWKSSTRSSPTSRKAPPKALIVTSGQARLHRRRRHQGVRRHPHARPGVRADPPGPAGARQARGTALRHGRRHQWLRARRRTRSRARLPLSRAASTIRRATLGFPEVQLGVHPGFGGTVRAVQLAGPIAAMDLMLTGRSIRPKQALAMGLVDRARAGRAARHDGEAGRAQPAARSQPKLAASPAELCGWCGRSWPARCARRSRGARVPSTTLPRTP